jgi:hypothetical protein
MKVPKRSPWGTVDYAKEVAPGILSVSTPGHGGIKLSRAMNAKMPATVRRKGGWCEEDCEWSLVALVFPEAFAGNVEHAKTSAKNWFPDEYEALTGEKVAVEESCVLRDRAFKAATADKFVAKSARGDWADDVPTGMVGVTAYKASTGETASFLVPASEYRSRGANGFVVDESKHEAC